MSRIHGFDVLRDEPLDEYAARAVLYRHARTGAQLLSLIQDDTNKVFGVSFRTPPKKSTGVPHILEHSVLCGSRKYPVREPFVELLKGSLHTFLNAFTYPDKTCYPVASTNLRDFYNLIDVYLDAVFFPRISREVFLQEGWHYERDANGELSRSGVVYNEMKGVYSSPDSVLAEFSQRLLFPDTTYGVDSGGDPEIIPTLTYEDFVAFHRDYYHPGNARFFFSGDDDPTERLRLLDAYCSEFDARTVDSAVPLQPAFDSPRHTTMRLSGLGLTATGRLDGDLGKPGTEPRFVWQFSTNAFSPKALLASLGITLSGLPEGALSSLETTGEAVFSPSALGLTVKSLRLDGQNLAFSATMTDFRQPAMPRPSSVTSTRRCPSSRRAVTRTVPPASLACRPWRTLFSTKGWIKSGGTSQSSAPGASRISLLIRSPNRACSMAR